MSDTLTITPQYYYLGYIPADFYCTTDNEEKAGMAVIVIFTGWEPFMWW